MVMIRTQGLRRCFGPLVVVRDLDLEVQAGEVFGLLGPNGAGKSTVIKMLMTLLPPSGGRSWVAGHDVAGEPAAVRRVIGYVPQLLSADGLLTGQENLQLFARLYDVPRTVRRSRIEQAIVRAGLEDAVDRLVNTYSGGMIRRLEIAQSMLHQPRVLFLDEPTIGLDPVARTSVWEQIEQSVALLTTHYMEEAERLCDRVGILHHGRLMAVGSPMALKAAIGQPTASLEEVFMHFTDAEIGPETGGRYREVAQTRRSASRLG